MATALGARLVQACEELCEELRRGVGLTLFRIELDRHPTPLVITLRPGEALYSDPRHDWMRPSVPATLERSIVQAGRRVGTVRIQDERHSAYPDDAVASVEAILSEYAGQLAQLLDEGQL
ncbi:MAG: hypothetical protein HYY42_06110 [Chloroflexi bacterium]|nr:hypothetical protein [Chloroflexota bacterium]MBI2983733.1 hypothetical protein [Chloroflexota bacterium]